MPHEHLSLQRLHSLKGNTHNDDDGGTADCQVPDTTHQVAGDNGQQGYDAKVHSTKDNDLVDNLLDKVGGRSAGTEARDEATVLIQIVGNTLAKETTNKALFTHKTK